MEFPEHNDTVIMCKVWSAWGTNPIPAARRKRFAVSRDGVAGDLTMVSFLRP
jgi:hypothetical protein